MTDTFLPFRTYDPAADLPRLLRLRQASETADQDLTPNPEETLRAQLSLPGHDPARDRRVVPDPADPDELIAYNLVYLPPAEQTAQANVLVHPAWRQKGIGSALLQQAIEHARTLGASRISLYANARHPASAAFLRQHGFSPAGAYTELRAAGDLSLPPIVFPYGYQLRTYAQVNDLATLTQAMNEAYQFLPGHHIVSQEQMAEWLPAFDPHGLFLVFSEKNRPVGISRVEMSAGRSARNQAPTGYIDAPGISSPHRRLDLYRALLLTGIQYLQSQAPAWIELESWGDTQAVLGLYQEMGFEILRQVLTFTRPLT